MAKLNNMRCNYKSVFMIRFYLLLMELMKVSEFIELISPRTRKIIDCSMIPYTRYFRYKVKVL